jgi:hypothetical protein
VIYYVALGSGLRASEVASLRPESFRLDGEIPLVIVDAAHSKHGRRDEQPLQPDLVAILRGYLADRPVGEPLWPGSWSKRAAEMLRGDLARAGIPYVDDDGHYADFHAQRHTYITVAGRHLPLQMAQLIARHGDVRMTQRYMHLQVRDAASAASQLPPLVVDKSPDSEALQATGTDDQRMDRLPHPCQDDCISVPFRAPTCTTEGTESEAEEAPEPPEKPRKPRNTKGPRALGGKRTPSKFRCS